MSRKYFLWGEEREAQEIYTEHAKKRVYNCSLHVCAHGTPKGLSLSSPSLALLSIWVIRRGGFLVSLGNI